MQKEKRLETSVYLYMAPFGLSSTKAWSRALATVKQKPMKRSAREELPEAQIH
jgi:hypothetical protein